MSRFKTVSFPEIANSQTFLPRSTLLLAGLLCWLLRGFLGCWFFSRGLLDGHFLGWLLGGSFLGWRLFSSGLLSSLFRSGFFGGRLGFGSSLFRGGSRLEWSSELEGTGEADTLDLVEGFIFDSALEGQLEGSFVAGTESLLVGLDHLGDGDEGESLSA